MSVGTIISFDGLRSTLTISGVAHKTNSLNGANDLTSDTSQSTGTKYTFGSSGLDQINQVVRTIFTATKNTTTTLTASNGFTNVVGDTAATFTLIKKMRLEYLTTAQDSVNGTAATGNVTVQSGALRPITTMPWGSGSYIMKPGDKWDLETHGASSGVTVALGSAENLDFVNADAAVDAHFLLIMFGLK